MSELSSYEVMKQKLQEMDLVNRTKGSIFEKISKHLLRERDNAEEYTKVSLWNDWEHRGNERDCGIDLVIETEAGEFIAVQCKFYQDAKVSFPNLGTFFTKLQSGVGEIQFAKGIIITTSDLTLDTHKQIAQIRKNKPIDLITEQDFIESSIDWETINFAKDGKTLDEETLIQNKKTPRPHQKEAIEATETYFSDPAHTRGKLIMACGTGKTFTSLRILESISPKDGITLFLAPSIALVDQTYREYCIQKKDPFIASIVCSDTKTGKNEEETSFSELSVAPSTNAEDILKSYERARKEKKRLIIFSTYQSALRIKEAQALGLGEIDLMICDEAHRSVGAMYSLSEFERKEIFGEDSEEASPPHREMKSATLAI